MKKYSEIFIRQRKLTSLDSINAEDFNSFENATNEIIKAFYKDLESYSLKSDDLESKISANYAVIETYETEEQLDLIHEQLNCDRQSEYITAYLNSLVEMKIVYLFKSLELTIKYLIRTAYPNIGVKSLFKWENIKDFFRNRGIDISIINGYLECIEVKKINNCIKHNGIVNEEIQTIPEFKGHSYLEHKSLEMFYNRINKEVENFCIALKEKIKEDLYLFSNERLTQLTDDFHERMDDRTMKEFIEKLKEKLQ